jgi:hypothetical protein
VKLWVMSMSIRTGLFVLLASVCLITLPVSAAETTQTIDASSFKCIRDLTAVGDFYVDNLHGDVAATVQVASSKNGGIYPPGSVVQLVPTEVMVKREAGFNAATRDWEFFELEVSAEGTGISARGLTETVNRFGGNCFACHIQARPEWDLICGKDHGCDPIPLTPIMITAIQKTDPRCEAVDLSTDEVAALKALAAAMSPPE